MNFHRRLSVALSALAGLTVLSAVAVAQEPGEEDPAEALAAILEEASVARDAGDVDKAVELLKKAHGLYPDPGFLYNAAAVYDSAGRCTDALLAYARAGTAAVGGEIERPEVVGEVQAWLLKASCAEGDEGTTELVDAFQIYKDGGLAVNIARRFQSAGQCDPARAYYLEAVDNSEKGSRARDIALAELRVLKCEEPVETPVVETKPSGPSLNTVAIATTGVGVALVLTGLLFDSATDTAISDLEDEKSRGNTSRFRDLKDTASSHQSWSRITYISGALVTAGGAALWYLDIRPLEMLGGESSAEEALRLAPWVGRDQAGAQLGFGF